MIALPFTSLYEFTLWVLGIKCYSWVYSVQPSDHGFTTQLYNMQSLSFLQYVIGRMMYMDVS